MPEAPQTTKIAASNTRRALSTSMVKSTWPKDKEGQQKRLIKASKNHTKNTWSVDDIDVKVLPFAISCSGLDCNALFTLEIHRIHLGTNTIFATDLVDLVNPAGVKKNSFRKSGFPAVNMCRNSNVPLKLYPSLQA